MSRVTALLSALVAAVSGLGMVAFVSGVQYVVTRSEWVETGDDGSTVIYGTAADAGSRTLVMLSPAAETAAVFLLTAAVFLFALAVTPILRGEQGPAPGRIRFFRRSGRVLAGVVLLCAAATLALTVAAEQAQSWALENLPPPAMTGGAYGEPWAATAFGWLQAVLAQVGGLLVAVAIVLGIVSLLYRQVPAPAIAEDEDPATDGDATLPAAEQSLAGTTGATMGRVADSGTDAHDIAVRGGDASLLDSPIVDLDAFRRPEDGAQSVEGRSPAGGESATGAVSGDTGMTVALSDAPAGSAR